MGPSQAEPVFQPSVAPSRAGAPRPGHPGQVPPAVPQVPALLVPPLRRRPHERRQVVSGPCVAVCRVPEMRASVPVPPPEGPANDGEGVDVKAANRPRPGDATKESLLSQGKP